MKRESIKIWSEEEEVFIRENYIQFSAKEIADKMGLRKTQVKNKIFSMKLSLPEDIRKKRKESTRFQQGSVPWTKGKKQYEYMSSEAIERTKANRFKKGIVPHNMQYDGAITIRKDGSGHKYKWIRISKNNWIHLHRYIWEKEFGTVPEDMCVVFSDGNSMICESWNLKLITKEENLNRNKELYFSALELIRETNKDLFLQEKAKRFATRLERSLLRIHNRNLEKQAAKDRRLAKRADIQLEKLRKREEKKKQRELNKIQKLKEKQLAKIKLPDYGSINIISEDLFYRSVQQNWYQLFGYCVSLTKHKELAQDLLHEMISRNNGSKESSFDELKNAVYEIWLEEQRIVRKHNTNPLVLDNLKATNDSLETVENDVQKAIESLPPKEKQIAHDFYLEELPEEELMSKYNISSEEISGRIFKINELLRSKLSKYQNKSAA